MVLFGRIENNSNLSSLWIAYPSAESIRAANIINESRTRNDAVQENERLYQIFNRVSDKSVGRSIMYNLVQSRELLHPIRLAKAPNAEAGIHRCNRSDPAIASASSLLPMTTLSDKDPTKEYHAYRSPIFLLIRPKRSETELAGPLLVTRAFESSIPLRCTESAMGRVGTSLIIRRTPVRSSRLRAISWTDRSGGNTGDQCSSSPVYIA